MSTVLKFISLDPGTVSGVSFANYLDPLIAPTSAQEPTWDAVRSIDLELQAWPRGSVVVFCESFIPRPGAKSWQPEALYSIGAVQYLCLRHGARLELQTPANAKSFSTDAKLKRLGWYEPTEGGHVNDSRRHLLLGLVRHKVIRGEDLT